MKTSPDLSAGYSTKSRGHFDRHLYQCQFMLAFLRAGKINFAGGNQVVEQELS